MSNIQWPTAEAAPEVKAQVETPEQFISRRDTEIMAWLEAKAALDASKTAENERRLQVTKTLFPTPKKGTQRYPLNGGHSVKLVFGWNYTLGDKEATDEAGLKIPVQTQINQLEKEICELGPEGALLVERLIRWKPELVPAEYERLNLSTASEVEVQTKALVDEYLKVSEASPQLVFEVPKPK